MKKIINKPSEFVDEMIEGLIGAYGDQIELLNGDKRIIVNANKKKEKVGIVTAGGSGHLPVFLGYVGEGMLDGCAVGNVFASPSAQKMADMIKACDSGKGVLCLYGNYGGDNMNFEMACSLAEMDDIITERVLVRDDVASAPLENAKKRRGVAGMVYAFKVAGAAADRGDSLCQVVQVTQRALDNIRTIGVALTPCVIPDVGKPTFTIPEDEIVIGMGIHGEPGLEERKMMPADDLTDLLFAKINDELQLQPGDRVSVMVNGLGATPTEELLIVYRRVHLLLVRMGVETIMPHIGEYATSMEMAGFSLTVFKLDCETEELLSRQARTPFYRV